jgi:hypothetical protein
MVSMIHTSIELGESKTDKTVSVGVLLERLRDGVGKLDSLVLNSHTSNADNVGTNSSSSAGAIAIADLELSTGGFLEGGRLGRIESGMLTNDLRVKFSAEHPAV